MSAAGDHTTRDVVIIPARYASSRFPGKPLVPLLGRPMILWVAELSAEAVGSHNVVVATEDARIARCVEAAGYQTILTAADALTGTDRLAEAATHIQADCYINVQGDEPLVRPADIQRVIAAKHADPTAVINGVCAMSAAEDPDNVNIPKVIATEGDIMVYMSRRALPGFKDAKQAPRGFRKQVCIYGFSAEDLAAFRGFGRKSHLEACEDIEILRFLELGRRIRLIETAPGSLAVDVPDDIPGVEAALRARHGDAASD